MSDEKRKGSKRTSGLLGDLESIRSLLEENDEPRDEEAGEDEDVPLLEDVVRGGVSVNESFLSGEGDFTETGEGSGLNDEIFKALLSDEWREAARDLLDEARAAIEKHQHEWTPEHTDELNQALKVRIDETVQQWLRQVVQSRIEELRSRLLEAVSGQIRTTIDEQFNRTSTHEDPDGE
jgi:hypothetical protein